MKSALSRSAARLLARVDLAPARECFERACAASRKWDSVVSESVAVHGNRPQGGFVSGIYSEHFPELTQRILRALARQVTEENEKGYSLRPFRVQSGTMSALRHAVKTRDGCGYYG